MLNLFPVDFLTSIEMTLEKNVDQSNLLELLQKEAAE